MKLKEFARLLGLSPTTVSRALNGYPEVNAETRERVVAAARRHGYAPNQAAKRLATGRAMAVGHVVPLAAYQYINPHFADFIAGAAESYSAAGYDMLLTVVPAAEETAAYRALAAQGRVDGIMVHSPRHIEPRIDLLTSLGLPFLVHGRDRRPEDDYCWIDINNRRAFQRATDLLLDLGHRRIALLNGLPEMSFAHRRHLGYVQALEARGIAVDPALVRNAEMVEHFGHDTTLALVGGPQPPTAILTASSIIAFGVLRAVRELGLQPGRDISIVTHDDDLSFIQDRGPVPLFTATRSSIRAAGRRAAEMLIGLIARVPGAVRKELWEVELSIGQSTGPAPRD